MKPLIKSFILIVCVALLSCKGTGEKENTSKVEEIIEKVAPLSKEETVELNGVKHFVEIKGEGEPLIILHGGPGLPHNYLNPYFDDLAEHYTLYLYDQRGCGKTEFPQDTSTINPDFYVKDLDALMQHYNLDKAIIVGHSWGSLLALYFAKAYPEKVEKLILVAPAPIQNQYFDQAFNNMQEKRSEGDNKMLVDIMSSDAFKQGDPEVFLNAIKLGESINLANPTSADEVFKNLSFTPTSAKNMLLVNSMMEKYFFDFNLSSELGAVTMPAMILYGESDNFPLISAQNIAESLPNATLVVIKNAGHYPFAENHPEFMKQVKTFLLDDDNI